MRSRIDPSMIPAFPDLSLEKQLWDQGYDRIGGVDEAGRGALAGPVAAAVVILPPDTGVASALEGVLDSKQMTAAARLKLAARIKKIALDYHVGFADPQEIDRVGILPATKLAAYRAIKLLEMEPAYLLLDYLLLDDLNIPQVSLIKGDARSMSIAAASIMAKTARDSLMQNLGSECPEYGFEAHKGYGTFRHKQAIDEFGATEYHRMTFSPFKKEWE